MDLLWNSTSAAVQKSLDGLSKRQIAITSNVANVDTPGYRRKGVSFEASLQEALNQEKGIERSIQADNDLSLNLRTTNPSHISLSHSLLGGISGANGSSSNNGSRIEDVEPELSEAEENDYRNDKSSVDVESEMASLAKNTQRYVALTNIQSRRGRLMKTVISESVT